MRICLIGKYPPIQGGVSMRNYWSAHALAMRGHDVHVVTNANEAQAPFRMLMREDDWNRCGATYGAGAVTVHWTDPVDSSQSYIPMASPFTTKLAGVAARVHAEYPVDVILSYYLEPYAVAGHLSAEICGVPHVVRMAGSDAGKLWCHPQFEPLYDHVLRSAHAVIAGGVVAERARQRGVDPYRIIDGGGFTVPADVFSPLGSRLDFTRLRADAEADADFRDLFWGGFKGDQPYFGIYGKLGDSKGSFALLAALNRLRQAGMEINLVALAHGQMDVERSFRTQAKRLGLVDHVLQIPFLPHWCVPEFLRGCLAVCCLEQDFPIAFHTPIMPREVLLCGACLVGSTEIIRKLGACGCLADGYSCVAINDVNDIDLLSARLGDIVREPGPAAVVGSRGREFALAAQERIEFPRGLEEILAGAARRRSPKRKRRRKGAMVGAGEGRFRFTQWAADAFREQCGRAPGKESGRAARSDLKQAQRVLGDVERAINRGCATLRRFAPAIRLEIAIAAAEKKATGGAVPDSLFRLRLPGWAMLDNDLPDLVPSRDPNFRILKFDEEISSYRTARKPSDLPTSLPLGPSYILAFGYCPGREQNPLLVDARTVRLLEHCDGSRTVREIAGILDREDPGPKGDNYLESIQKLFVAGVLGLQDTPTDPVPSLLVARVRCDAKRWNAQSPIVRKGTLERKSS